MRFNYLKATLKDSGAGGIGSPPWSRCGRRAGQSDRAADEHNAPGRHCGADVGLQLRRSRCARDLRRVESACPGSDRHYAGRLVPRRDYSSHGISPDDQPHE